MNQAFTQTYKNQVSEIVTEAFIFPDFEEGKLPPLKYYTDNACWDTGSERTVISQDLAKALGLQSLGKVSIRGVGEEDGGLYKIAIGLPNSTLYHGYYVYGMEMEDYDVLIGMDLIKKCDFALTNQNGKTTFSFRIPSSITIDFQKEDK